MLPRRPRLISGPGLFVVSADWGPAPRATPPVPEPSGTASPPRRTADAELVSGVSALQLTVMVDLVRIPSGTAGGDRVGSDAGTQSAARLV